MVHIKLAILLSLTLSGCAANIDKQVTPGEKRVSYQERKLIIAKSIKSRNPFQFDLIRMAEGRITEAFIGPAMFTVRFGNEIYPDYCVSIVVNNTDPNASFFVKRRLTRYLVKIKHETNDLSKISVSLIQNSRQPVNSCILSDDPEEFKEIIGHTYR
jgi:hypothetical protein